jgi:hypothetical protein
MASLGGSGAGHVCFLHDLKKIPPEQGFSAGEAQIPDPELAEAVDDVDSFLGVKSIVPSGLPVIAGDTFGLTIFCKFEACGQRLYPGRQQGLGELAHGPEPALPKSLHPQMKHYKLLTRM